MIESAKTWSEIHMPVYCKVIEINEDLENSLKIFNEDSYTSGWICCIENLDKAAIDSLMNASQYDSQITT